MYIILLVSSFALFALAGLLYSHKRSVSKLVIALSSLAVFFALAVVSGLSTTDAADQKKEFVVLMFVWVFLLTVYLWGVAHVTGRQLSQGLSYMKFRRFVAEKNLNGFSGFLLLLGPVLVLGLAALVVFAYLLE